MSIVPKARTPENHAKIEEFLADLNRDGYGADEFGTPTLPPPFILPIGQLAQVSSEDAWWDIVGGWLNDVRDNNPVDEVTKQPPSALIPGLKRRVADFRQQVGI